MPFDGVYMRRIIEEINEKIEGPLRNIYQPTKVDYYLQFQDATVRISLNPTMAFMAISEKMKNPSQMPPSFTMLLRKYLRNARFLGVEQDGYSRVANFRFRRLDEKGDERECTLVVEIMGKHSNMILVSDEGKVVDAHRRIVTGKGRELIPGRWFVPFRSDKLDPMTSSIDEIFSEIQDVPIEVFLVRRLEGISKVLATEIVHRAGFSFSFSALELTEKRREALERALREFREEYSEGRTYLLTDSAKPIEISPVRLHHTGFHHEPMGPSEAAVKLYSFKENLDILRNKKRDLEKVVVREIDKLEGVIEKLERELKRLEGFEKFRKFGELLLSNAYGLDLSKEKVKVTDWESGDEIEIEVDPKKDVFQNTQEYFEKYKKSKRRKEGIEKRLEEVRKELSYLYQLWQTIVDAEEVEDLEEIRGEMEGVGLLHPQRRKKEVKRRGPRKIVYKGFTILIGRNNRQNDELVRSASPDDVWLHAREIPGAHVLVKAGGREVPEDVLEMAASLAAGYSRGKDSGKVPVDYTLAKYVKKPKGFKPGMVIYRNQRTMVVTPKRLEG